MTEPTITCPNCKTEIKDLDRQIKEARRSATAALTLEAKLAAQKQIKALEAQRNQKRRTLFDAQDRIRWTGSGKS